MNDKMVEIKVEVKEELESYDEIQEFITDDELDDFDFGDIVVNDDNIGGDSASTYTSIPATTKSTSTTTPAVPVLSEEEEEITNQDFYCDKCFEGFTNKGQYKMHMRRHNGYHCEECQKNFSKRTLLNQHNKKVHNIKFEYKCTVCYKIFPRKIQLRLHSRIHWKERFYKCIDCDKRFPTNGLLYRHARTQHQKCPFYCDLCSQKFSNKWQLEKHNNYKHKDINNDRKPKEDNKKKRNYKKTKK